MTLANTQAEIASPTIFNDLGVFRGGIRAQRDVVADRLRVLGSYANPVRPDFLTLGSNGSQVLTLPTRPNETLETRLFDVLVNLKVSVSEYAMHISAEERHKIFDQLDAVINVEDWHEEDDLPRAGAFREFLKWLVYSGCFGWASLGVSDEGNILVAWNSDRTLLTANFSGSAEIRWTARIQSPAGIEHAAGKSSLQYFSKQIRFYLEG
jgi:hypothetical protein